jgi:hypothetical protein
MFSLEHSGRVDCGEVERHPFTLFKQQTFELADGEIVKIEELYQHHTYRGMLCGYPMDIDGTFERAVDDAKARFPHLSAKAAVITPVISYGRTQSIDHEGDTSVVDWEMLPQITAIAVLQRKGSFDSVLAIWFQDQMGLPDSDIIDQIKAISWARHVVENDP